MVKTDQIIFATAGGFLVFLLAGIGRMYYNSSSEQKKINSQKEKINRASKMLSASKTVKRKNSNIKTQAKIISDKKFTRKALSPSAVTTKFLLENPPHKK